MRSALIRTAILATITLPTAFSAVTIVQDGPDLTHEEYLELLILNTTEGWEPLSCVPHYMVEDGDVLDLGNSSGLEKRAANNQFNAYSLDDCGDGYAFTAKNFECGLCISGNNWLKGGWMYRLTGGKHPTASWYTGWGCSGGVVHSYGVVSGQDTSCDTAAQFNIAPAYVSAMLYYSCCTSLPPPLVKCLRQYIEVEFSACQ